jgi:hypothetical protein
MMHYKNTFYIWSELLITWVLQTTIIDTLSNFYLFYKTKSHLRDFFVYVILLLHNFETKTIILIPAMAPTIFATTSKTSAERVGK